ncbi:MAG: hypothetical protein HZA53_18355 [Planctomycetes bacterium]|nr:hypothetical protein [Planctomycetota bacterium]
MEVTNTSNQGPVPLRRPANDDRIDITRVNRDGIQDATVDISEIRAPQEPFKLRGQRGTDDSEGTRTKKDSIELSEEARRLLAEEQTKTKDADGRREQHVADMARLYRMGELNTRERIERAAVGMLEAE